MEARCTATSGGHLFDLQSERAILCAQACVVLLELTDADLGWRKCLHLLWSQLEGRLKFGDGLL